MTSHTPAGDDQAHPNLPFAADLRSATDLSELLGFAVRPQRIRIKPGHSAIVAWRREGTGRECAGAGRPDEGPVRPGGFDDWGWTAVVTSEDKLANIHRRARRLGQPVIVHDAADPRPAETPDGVLLSGSPLSDARLGKQIVRALDQLDGRVEVIGYNPGRRVLLKHTPNLARAEFVRIGAGSQTDLVVSAAQWADWDLPTLPVTYLDHQHTAVSSPWWGIGDLESHPEHSLAEEVGVIAAELHRHSLAEVDRPVDPSPLEQMERSFEVLRRLLPEVETAVGETVRAVQDRLTRSRTVLRPLHGDLSPDQVLVGGGECRVIDLDRAGVGPIGMDLGRWVAACRNLRRTIGAAPAHDLEIAFLDGYRWAGGTVVDLDAWTAWAMLTTALEPWRSCDPNWKDDTVRMIVAAREATGLRASGNGLEQVTR